MTSKVYLLIFFNLITGYMFAQDTTPRKKVTFSLEQGVEHNQTRYYLSLDSEFSLTDQKPAIYGGHSLATTCKVSYAATSRWRIDALAGITPQRVTLTSMDKNTPTSYRTRQPTTEHLNIYADISSGISYQQPLFWKLKIAPFVRTGYLISFQSDQVPSHTYVSPGVDLLIGKFYVSASWRVGTEYANKEYPTKFLKPDVTISDFWSIPRYSRFSIGYCF